MAERRVKSLEKPDEVLEFPKLTVRVVELGDIRAGHFVNEPGWSWAECTRPKVGRDCPDLVFEDRGVRALKGLDGEWRLSALRLSEAKP